MADNRPAPDAAMPVTSISTADFASSGPPAPADGPDATPIPQLGGASPASQASGASGTDGEETIWEGRYSQRNFIGQGIYRILATVAWLALVYYTWRMDHLGMAVPTWIVGLGVGVYWLVLFWRMIQARFTHYYRLTNRRLFVSTGIIHRRRDMIELLRINDVKTRQGSLFERWFGLGTVVVMSNEKQLPDFYLAGVDDPKQVMDMIFHHSRSERDQHSVKVDQV